MDPPPPKRRSNATGAYTSSSSSVQYLGSYDPSSTVDFHRRARERGVIDLTSFNHLTSQYSHQNPKKRHLEEFSVPGGKRTKSIQTRNQSHYCITLQQRWDQGAFRWVHKGQYSPDPKILGDDGGPQNGQLCVLKEFKTGSVYEDSFFKKDIMAVEKARSLICAFNAISGGKTIHLNQPAVWQDVYPDSTGRHKKKLVEPMLEGEFLKFNSNSGYTNGAEFMQALSHFSYHSTNGQQLLCDLQGGHYEDSYVLTDPVIMSADNSKSFGSGDLGSEGIDNFFAHHCCNKFCRAHWLKPSRPQVSTRIPRVASTSFSLTLGTSTSEAERTEKLARLNQSWMIRNKK